MKDNKVNEEPQLLYVIKRIIVIQQNEPKTGNQKEKIRKYEI